jgi:hypothetical protein
MERHFQPADAMHMAKSLIGARAAVWAGSAILVGCGLVCLAGCDLGGTYSKRYNESITSVGQRAATAAMLHGDETAVPAGDGKPSGMQLRLPSVLDANSKSLPATEPRAQPPFMKIPGLNYAYERMLDDPADATKFAPVYCYLGAVPKADQPVDALQADLLKQAQAAVPGAAWSDVQLASPSGSTVAAKMLSLSGPQDFDNGQIGGPVAKLEGQMDLYLYEGATHHVLIGFRAPTAQAGKYRFFDAAKLAMGTLK